MLMRVTKRRRCFLQLVNLYLLEYPASYKDEVIPRQHRRPSLTQLCVFESKSCFLPAYFVTFIRMTLASCMSIFSLIFSIRFSFHMYLSRF